MAKTITIEEALKLIKDNDKIAVGDGTVEPQGFLSNLHTIWTDREDSASGCASRSDRILPRTQRIRQ